MYGQNFDFPNFKPSGMDSTHYDVNVFICLSLLSYFTFSCMELSYNHLMPWRKNILNKVIGVYIMKKLCEVCVIRELIIMFIKAPNYP